MVNPLRNLALVITLVLLVPLMSGCETRMQDPWVSNPDRLAQERERSPGQQKQLRERLSRVQTDR